MESITEIFAMLQEIFSFVGEMEASGMLDVLKNALSSIIELFGFFSF